MSPLDGATGMGASRRGASSGQGLGGGSMGPAERRSRILDLVATAGSVQIAYLAASMGVSLMTIHRDLDVLAKQQLVTKLRGTATVVPSMLFESGVPARMVRQGREKGALARRALDYIETGQAVMLDDSTTGVYLARLLPQRAPATVITNFLTVMRELSGKPGIRLIGLGGTYHDWADGFMGAMTVEAIRGLRADVLVMSTSAITNLTCYHQSQDTITFKRAMMDSSAFKLLYVDHTKFTRRALHALVPISAFDRVIVDDATPMDMVEQIRSQGVPVDIVAVDELAI
jgi:DeoR/GlpR family transcriptional regulator of sugar metabolism